MTTLISKAGGLVPAGRRGSCCGDSGYKRKGATMGVVSVRELKNRLTSYLRRARKGEKVIVTVRGRPVAVLQSLQRLHRPAALETRLAALRIATLPTRKGFGRTWPMRISGPSISRAILQDRR